MWMDHQAACRTRPGPLWQEAITVLSTATSPVDSVTGVDVLAQVRRAFDRCAPLYDESARVVEELGDRLLERLELLAIRPESVLDLGCGTGRLLPLLRRRYRRAQLVGVDVSDAMLVQAERRRGRWRKALLLQADAHALPVAAASFDLVVSNLLLPWCQNPPLVFAEIHRVLRPGGTVFFTTAGPDTLREYRQRWNDPPAERVYGLVDMHDLGDTLQATGFDAPVLDRENLTIDYPTVAACEADLRATGAVNLSLYRRRGLLAPSRLENIRSCPDVRFKVTLELVHGHAWRGQLPTQQTSNAGATVISADSLRQLLQRNRTR